MNNNFARTNFYEHRIFFKYLFVKGSVNLDVNSIKI